MPGSKSTQTTSSSSSPWGPTQGLLQDIVGQAGTVGGNVSNFTPTFSNTTMQGVQGLEQAGQQPGAAAGYLNQVVPGMGQGFQTGLGGLQNTAQGGNLQPNPYLAQMLDYANQNTANKVNEQFSGAGRYGSAAHSGALAREIGAQTTNAMMSNYNTERGYQNAANNTLYGGGAAGGALAGQLDQANLYDEQALLQAGQMRDQMATAMRTAPMTALEWQKNMVAPIGAMGGQQQGTQVKQTPANIPGMLMGGAMMAGGIASGNPFMALSGAGQAAGGFGGKGLFPQ